jgi:hypothetical protein
VPTAWKRKGHDISPSAGMVGKVFGPANNFVGVGEIILKIKGIKCQNTKSVDILQENQGEQKYLAFAKAEAEGLSR